MEYKKYIHVRMIVFYIEKSLKSNEDVPSVDCHIIRSKMVNKRIMTRSQSRYSYKIGLVSYNNSIVKHMFVNSNDVTNFR